MSELPEEALDYRTVVAEYFLGLRGSGLLLSPLDEELVASWERRGLPIAVVCRGLRGGMERLLETRAPHARLPRSLRAYRFAVEQEWAAYKSGRVGDGAAPPEEQSAVEARLEAAALQAQAVAESVRQDWRALYHRASSRLAEARGTGSTSFDDLEALLASIDDRILAGWISSLHPAQRAALGPRCRLLAGARPAGTRPAAYRQSLRAHLWDAARAAGLINLRGSV